HENRCVTGREEFQLVAAFLAHGSDKSGEPFRSEVLSKGLVDVLENRFQTIAHIEACSRIRTAYGSQDGRADAVAGYVCQDHDPAAVCQFLPIIEVPTGVIGAATPTGYLKSGNLRSNFWQERLLNGAGNLQFMCNQFELVLGVGFAKGGLDMRADFGRHSGRQSAGNENYKREV